MATVSWNKDKTIATIESSASRNESSVSKTKSGWVWFANDHNRITFAKGVCSSSKIAIANCALCLGEVDP